MLSPCAGQSLFSPRKLSWVIVVIFATSTARKARPKKKLYD